MPGRATSKTGDFPNCEYCGHLVYPGEEQELDHDSLIWHSAHCFRCYGCHREFHEGRPCHLLPNIALCADCYPRREFLVDEWKFLNEGENSSHKQGRVCFLSPVSKSESRNNSVHDIDSAFDQVPRRLAFATTEPSNHGQNEKLKSGEGVVAHSDVIGRPPDEAVTAQIADAMEPAAPNAEPPHAQTVNAATETVGRLTQMSCMIDGKFTVIAVDEWEQLMARATSETEYIKKHGNGDEDRLSCGSAASADRSRQSEEDVSVEIEAEWRVSSRTLRRSSSCSDLYKSPIPSDPRSKSISPQQSYCSNNSEDLVEFRSFPSSEDKEDIDQAREANPWSPPLPGTPQSSTPIPQSSHGFSSNDRPPSTFNGENGHASHEHSGMSKVSLRDVSVEQNEINCHPIEEVPSFQECRALFQKEPESKLRKICSACGKEVIPTDRFECLHRVYHLRCFRCYRCRARLNPKSFRDDGAEAFCKTCFLDLKVSQNRLTDKNRCQLLRARVNSL